MERIIDIIESIANEKSLPIDEVKQKVIEAVINTAKRLFGENKNFSVDVKKSLSVYQNLIVVADNDELASDEDKYISLSKARKESSDVEISDVLNYEISFLNLDRTAINWLYKELEENIQRLLEEKLFEKYQAMIDKMIFGSVVFIDDDENTFIEFDEIRAVLPRRYRIKGEKFKIGDVLKAVIKSVRVDKKQGLRLEISRTSPKFLNALLALEVPEIKDGAIEIVNSARIPGERAKVLLRANSTSVDAVGACVGSKGVRINAISKELNGENIDCIEYSNEAALVVSRALAPAIINSVNIQDDIAHVHINTEQRNKAIGKQGINIRLCSMITGLQIQLNENKNEENGISAEEAKANLENLFKNI
ncbi:transcription termination factor NusA [Campylobacter canadensis]|uniref:Transcription termination/antitermination protein NusA n=1 Tax=Campylobacter canadensis TaxID=449520 RepID=A0ABS7WUM4_9BACT|nr:transcription termination factor NusA [Campylobacter canadensis]MBZ7987724.1 transcription termination/antitermination protein NusA [Campylobacter canadensis]MBZ7994131.1 transcription termination/antitermination protein NusA [Campylobacter canadensis]MBZ7995866.1 transcription termination/antitermination protein NusA [Campylobacter canadensis]MBZ7997503.1 transcription termination/antitermination protein NusA [Campylobacter canadensis]MBZ7999462.1 transcription termination/antitermination 